jgi:hypothetical protein
VYRDAGEQQPPRNATLQVPCGPDMLCAEAVLQRFPPGGVFVCTHSRADPAAAAAFSAPHLGLWAALLLLLPATAVLCGLALMVAAAVAALGRWWGRREQVRAPGSPRAAYMPL